MPLTLLIDPLATSDQAHAIGFGSTSAGSRTASRCRPAWVAASATTGEGLAEAVEYVLIYGQPRPSTAGAGVIYETRRCRARHPSDSAAIGWATGIGPGESGLTQAGKRYPAVPMVLRRSRTVIWESHPGMALKVAG